MYAVIEDSGSQFRVTEGDVLNVDLRDVAAGTKEIEFPRVLLVSGEGGVKIGTPLVEGAKVVAEVLAPEVKGEKVFHFYFRRRKHSKRRIGHRQKYTAVKISKIVA